MSPEERERTRRYIERLDSQRARLRDEVEADVADYRGLSLQQRGDLIVRLCAGARAILESRPDRDKVLSYQDPPAPDFAEKWKAMRERYHLAKRSVR